MRGLGEGKETGCVRGGLLLLWSCGCLLVLLCTAAAAAAQIRRGTALSGSKDATPMMLAMPSGSGGKAAH